MRIVFAATGDIALPLLDALFKEHLIALVLTSPDAPGKRGKTLLPSPIKKRALELGLDVYTPSTLKREAREKVCEYNADMLISFCYGKIFGPKFLSLFSRTMNVHPSLLPMYRGCSPIYNIIKDSLQSGAVTLQEIALGVDEGRIYKAVSFPLEGNETEASLTERVAHIVPDAVISVLNGIDNIVLTEQQGEPSYTSFVNKDEGAIDFKNGEKEIHSLIRACYPWPKAYGMLNGEKLYITGVYGSAFEPFDSTDAAPGTILEFDKTKGLKVAAGDGAIYITRVLPPAKKEMDIHSYLNGQKNVIGNAFV